MKKNRQDFAGIEAGAHERKKRAADEQERKSRKERRHPRENAINESLASSLLRGFNA